MKKILRENALIIYPFLLIGSFYATWFAARYHLGYYPVASVDDPKSIDGFWMWTYSSTFILVIIGLPVAITLVTYQQCINLRTKTNSTKLFFIKLVIGLCLLIIAYWIMGNEPNDILGWLLD